MENKSKFKEFLKLGSETVAALAIAGGMFAALIHQEEIELKFYDYFETPIFSSVEDLRFKILKDEALKDMPASAKVSYLKQFLDYDTDTSEYKESLKNKEFFERELIAVKKTRDEYLMEHKIIQEKLANDPEYQKIMKELKQAEKNRKPEKPLILDLSKEITPEQKAAMDLERKRKAEEYARTPPPPKVVLRSIHEMREKVENEITNISKRL